MTSNNETFCLLCQHDYSEHRDGDEACPGHWHEKDPPLFVNLDGLSDHRHDLIRNTGKT